jgi:hypothetical protein
MEFFGQEILGLKIPTQDYYCNDDVLASNFDSDSDILVTLEKRPISSNFWTTIAQHWLGLKTS